MDKDKNTTLSHLYGIGGLVPGLIGLAYLVKTDATWKEYALLASGWFAAILYGVMLVRCFSQARVDGEAIGTLKEMINSLNKEIKNQAESYEKDAARDRDSYERRIDSMAHAQSVLSTMLMNGAATARKRSSEIKTINASQPEGQS